MGFEPRNDVTICGKAIRDAEYWTSKSGTRNLRFTVAVLGRRDDAPPTYVDCFATDDVVDGIDGFVERGEMVEVIGALTFRGEPDENGVWRNRIMVIADSVRVEE